MEREPHATKGDFEHKGKACESSRSWFEGDEMLRVWGGKKSSSLEVGAERCSYNDAMPTHLTTQGDDCSDVARFAHDLVRASFAADAFCLGPHWIYDLSEIDRLYPDGLSGLDAPRSSYHGEKAAGDFTHHGDQSLVLLESLLKRKGYSASGWLEDFAAYWASEPDCYFDGAARDTLANLKAGREEPSSSDDLAGVSRMAPLLAWLADRPLDLQVSEVRELVGVTHGDPSVADAGEFFTRAIAAARKGKSYDEAFDQALAEGEYTVGISEYVSAAKANLGGELQAVAKSIGQSCSTSKAFPLTVWFALSYGDDPVKLLEANALAAGDNSARGMILAMLLAARGQFKELPETWTIEQSQRSRVEAALSKLSFD